MNRNQVFELWNIYNLGLTSEEIGKKLKISGTTIRRWFKRHNLKIRNKSEKMKGTLNPSWKFKTITEDGYIEIWDYKTGKRVLEHRYNMEKSLGRKLDKNELVHHRDGDVSNNRISNLKLCNKSSHRDEHRLEAGKWTRNYEFCKKCYEIGRKHASHGLCTRCYTYARTVQKRGFEIQYNKTGKRIFTEEHRRHLSKAMIGNKNGLRNRIMEHI